MNSITQCVTLHTVCNYAHSVFTTLNTVCNKYEFEYDNMCQQTEAKEVLFSKLTPLGVVKLPANMSCQANVDGVQQQNVTRPCVVNEARSFVLYCVLLPICLSEIHSREYSLTATRPALIAFQCQP